MSTDLDLAVAIDAENPVAHDLLLVSSSIPLVGGTDAIAQHIRVRLRFFLAEWFLNKLEGLPYFRDVFIKNPSPSLITAVFRQVVLDTPGVEVISSFNLQVDSTIRTLDVEFVALLESGEVLSADFGDFIVEIV